MSSAAAFPPELQLLLAFLRSALGTGDLAGADLLAREVSWKTFGAAVERHGVGAFLLGRLAPPARALVPPATLQRWRQLADTTSRRAQGQGAEVIRLTRLLEGAGIPAISVKGPLLARQLYGDLGQRRAGDIDLLVAPKHAERADTLLREAGYPRSRPDFELSPVQMRQYLEVQYEFEYAPGPSGVRVEVMWLLEGVATPDDLWDRAPTASLDGRPIRILPTELNARYLLQHGARHGWYRFFWLVDAALLLLGENVDWTAVRAQARALHGERAVLQGVLLARDLLGVPVPAAFGLTPADEKRAAPLLAEARRQIALPATASPGTFEWLRQLRYRLQLQESAAAKLRVLRPHLVSLASWKTIRLPDRWFFLYHVLTPFLWVRRRLGRGRSLAGPPGGAPDRAARG